MMIDTEAFLRSGKTLGTEVRHLPETDSTNPQARKWLMEGAPHGSVVLTEHQTAGRGRFSRNWESERGKNLLFTVILRQPDTWPLPGLLPLTAALSVMDGIQQASGLESSLKWPNDVLLEDRKVAGILVERIVGAANGSIPGVLVGIGININQTRFGSSIEESATSLILAAGRPIDRRAVYHAVLDALSAYLNVCANEPQQIRTVATGRLTGIGTRVSLRQTVDGSPVRGTLLGIAPDGGLELAVDGSRNVYYAGDVTTESS